MKAMKGILVVVILAFAGYGAYTIICGEIGKEEAFPDSLRRELEESGMNLGGPGSDPSSGSLFTESGELAPLNDISLGEASSTPPGSLGAAPSSGVPPMFASDDVSPPSTSATNPSSADASADVAPAHSLDEPFSEGGASMPMENTSSPPMVSAPGTGINETMPPLKPSVSSGSYAASAETGYGEAPPVGGNGMSPEQTLPSGDSSSSPMVKTPEPFAQSSPANTAPPATPPQMPAGPSSLPATTTPEPSSENTIPEPSAHGSAPAESDSTLQENSRPSIGLPPSSAAGDDGSQGPKIGDISNDLSDSLDGLSSPYSAAAPPVESTETAPEMPPLDALPDTTPAMTPERSSDVSSGPPNIGSPSSNAASSAEDDADAGFASVSQNGSMEQPPWNHLPNTSNTGPTAAVPTGPGTEPANMHTPPPFDPSSLEVPPEQSLAPPGGEMPVPRQSPAPQAGGLAMKAEESELINPLEKSSPPPAPAAEPGGPQPPPMDFSAGEVRQQVVEFLEAIRALCASGKYGEAFQWLSPKYSLEGLSAEERRAITQMLDFLAGVVIYSRKPILEPAYQVRAGETLKEIAAKYDVSAELLGKINGVPPEGSLVAGQTLKVVRGPFHAQVDIEKHELLLTLGEENYYAGRFPIGVGRNQVGLEGEYTVREKRVNPPFIGPEGRIDADDPNNPLGERWIGLNHEIGIHGTPSPEVIGTSNAQGIICLAAKDVEDVFDILTIGSRVTIVR